MKVRISYFETSKLDPRDYIEDVVEVTEEQFEAVVLPVTYYDEEMDMYYTKDNNIGYQILEY